MYSNNNLSFEKFLFKYKKWCFEEDMYNNGCNITEKEIRNESIDYYMWLVIGRLGLIEYSDVNNSSMNEISRITKSS
jgi:hypothetical protein